MKSEMTAKIYNFQEEKEKRQKDNTKNQPSLSDKSGVQELDEIFAFLNQKAAENEKFALREWSYNDNAIGWDYANGEHSAIVIIDGLFGIKMKYEDAEKLATSLLVMIKNTK